MESRSSHPDLVVLLPNPNIMGPPAMTGVVACLSALTPAEIQQRCATQSESVNAITSPDDSLIPRFRAAYAPGRGSCTILQNPPNKSGDKLAALLLSTTVMATRSFA